MEATSPFPKKKEQRDKNEKKEKEKLSFTNEVNKPNKQFQKRESASLYARRFYKFIETSRKGNTLPHPNMGNTSRNAVSSLPL